MIFNNLNKKSVGYNLGIVFLLAILLSVSYSIVYIRGVVSPEMISIISMDDKNFNCTINDQELSCTNDFVTLETVTVEITHLDRLFLFSKSTYIFKDVEVNLSGNYVKESNKIILTKDKVIFVDGQNIFEDRELRYKDLFVKAEYYTKDNTKLPVIQNATGLLYSHEPLNTTVIKMFFTNALFSLIPIYVTVLIAILFYTLVNYIIFRVIYKKSINYKYLFTVTTFATIPLLLIDVLANTILLESISGYMFSLGIPEIVTNIIKIAITFYISKRIIDYNDSNRKIV